MRRAAAAVLVAALLGAGCQTMTGRSVGQWVDDRALTARVKARLATAAAANLIRIHVDTYEGVVYLTGGVQTAEHKQQAEELAGEVAGVRLVVNNLHVTGGEAVAASPPTGERAGPAPPLAESAGIARLDLESGTPAWTRYAGFDAAGRRVATVFLVASSELGAQGIDDLDPGADVERLAIYPHRDGGGFYVVLWHTAPAEARRP